MMVGINKGSELVLNRIPENTIGVELGVWKGASSEKFIKKCKFLHLVDSWAVEPYKNNDENGKFEDYLKKYSKIVGSENVEDFQKFYDNIYESVKNKFENKPIKIHRKSTTEFFKTFNEMVDWVYIDAAHDHNGCYADLCNSLKIVKKGGNIFGDDYPNKPGVKSAVDKFVKEQNFILETLANSQYQIKIV